MPDSDVATGPPDECPARMPAEFGLATATFVVVASMVGVGILTTSGFTVFFVGSNQLMLALWVVGGLVAVCGALTQAELSAAMPRSGGDYVYLHEAYGPLAAFLTGWVSFLIGFAGPIAALADASATYLLIPLHLDDSVVQLATRGLATLAILTLAGVHISGRHWSVQVQGWTTVVKIVLLVLFVVAGFAAGWPHRGHLDDRPPLDHRVGREMIFALVYIFYAYTGWNAASYLAGEVADPQRRVPWAILLGTAAVVALYLGLNAVYAFALSADDIRALVNDPDHPGGLNAVKPIAKLAAERLFGPRVAQPFSVAIGLFLLSSLSAYILTGPRVVCAMAHAGQFPASAGRLTARAQTPAIATALQSGWALILLWTGSFESIVFYASVGLAIFSMLTISSVYVLRVRRPELPRPFRTPGYPFVPAVFLLMNSALSVTAFVQRPEESGLSLLSILAGVPCYFLWKRGRPRWAAAAVTDK
jgi:basic amino acid/polyamine antiporter, APA family